MSTDGQPTIKPIMLMRRINQMANKNDVKKAVTMPKLKKNTGSDKYVPSMGHHGKTVENKGTKKQ
jgi:hypothetical protein